jgi:hypothetical protein
MYATNSFHRIDENQTPTIPKISVLKTQELKKTSVSESEEMLLSSAETISEIQTHTNKTSSIPETSLQSLSVHQTDQRKKDGKIISSSILVLDDPKVLAIQQKTQSNDHKKRTIISFFKKT